MVTIQSTLDDIMKLDFNSREMLLEILQKRQIEERRAEIATHAKQSLKDYKSGKTTPANADEVISRLESI
ncbi:hypothetical protein [uncultured Mucilaginibacter sp.]|uniref:hypothetical protein n=1 Tax=uncultured Mucilaginibacter sp. TaxID=797541 RepID=UPI0025E3CF31|nr:hypothetical protein [uncultured Mucilaginibacter sp.]